MARVRCRVVAVAAERARDLLLPVCIAHPTVCDVYFHDTGLVCFMLGIRNQEELFAHPLRGALFENYIIAEVVKAYLHHRIPSNVFFWREQSGHEVDLLIEEGSVLHCVEIKSAGTVASDMFRGLKWWDGMAGQKGSSMTLVYGGSDSYTREGIAVRPWFSI